MKGSCSGKFGGIVAVVDTCSSEGVRGPRSQTINGIFWMRICAAIDERCAAIALLYSSY